MNHLIPPPTIPLLHPQGVFSGLSPAQPGISALGLGSLPGSVPMGIGALNAGLSGSTTGGTGAVAAAAIPSVGASVAAGAGAGAGVSNASPATAVASNPQAALAAARMVAHGMAGAATQKDDSKSSTILVHVRARSPLFDTPHPFRGRFSELLGMRLVTGTKRLEEGEGVGMPHRLSRRRQL